MQSGKLTNNGPTNWVHCSDNAGVHISGKNDFGGGTVTVEHYIQGAAQTLRSGGADLTYTADFDDLLELRMGDIVRLNLSGATDPELDWSITGAVRAVQP